MTNGLRFRQPAGIFVARATAHRSATSFDEAMREIVVSESWRDRLEDLSGRRRDLWLLVGAIAALVLGGLAFWSRGRPAMVAPPATSAATPVASAGTVLVHVAGAVARPGLYEISGDARVADAIDAAGGPRRKADLDAVNLAQPLTDSMKIEVPLRGTPAVAEASPGSDAAGMVSLNAADQATLETIPGIGPVKATAILEYRENVGSFASVDELLEVTGIGPATLEAIRPYVTL